MQPLDCANWVGGGWVREGAAFENRNPSDTREVVSLHRNASAEQVRTAVEAAREAAPRWAAVTPQQRADVMHEAASLVLTAREELARLLAREEGKTLPEALAEVQRAAQIFRYFAGEALRLDGQSGASLRAGVRVEVSREPVGVVALITPWNFPIAIPAWKLAPALAFGNAVVLKPSELAPASAWKLADILHRAGLPAGVFNLVCGDGATGKALVDAPVDAISFTGSVSTGAAIAKAAAARPLRVQLEMGGKNPLVVLDDADLDLAVNCAINGAYFSTGQRCTASSRLIVTQGIHDRFVAALLERLRALKIDHALKPGTDIGPVIDSRQLQKNLDYIQLGEREGARLLHGGRVLERDTPGAYLEPALFVGASNSMRLNREEVFGPLAAVIRTRDFDEALALANDTDFGLCAGICTTSLRHATAFRRHAQAGLVMVNLPTAGLDYHLPFGGRKASSQGPREQGEAAREFYTQGKTAYIAA